MKSENSYQFRHNLKQALSGFNSQIQQQRQQQLDYLEDLYVRPEARGQGIGKMMLSYLAALAKNRKCGRLEWWASSTFMRFPWLCPRDQIIISKTSIAAFSKSHLNIGS